MTMTLNRNYFWRLTDEAGLSDSNKETDADMDTNIDREHHKDCWCKQKPDSHSVKTT